MQRRRMPLLAAGLLGLPGAGWAQKAQPSQSALPSGDPGFVVHRDARGFQLQRPSDWTVIAPAPHDIMVISPDEGSAALIRARRAEGDLAQWLTRAWPGTEPSLVSAAPIGAQAMGPDVARAALRVTDRAGIVRRAHLLAVRRGEIATVFVAAAPEDQFAQRLPVLGAILDSFRLGTAGRPASQPAALPPLGRYTDPNEQAFTIGVPQGWEAQGGLLRRGPGGPTRVAVAMASPDRRMMVFIGDRQPARFVLPSQVILGLGMREGMPVQGTGDIVMRFRHAGDIGTELLNRRFGSIQVTGRRDLHELAAQRQRRQGAIAVQGAAAQATAAEIDFRLSDGRVGAASFVTEGYDVPGLGGGWSAEESYGFVAAAEDAPVAGMILSRVIGSFQLNPAWFVAETRGARVDADRQMAYLQERAATQQRMLEQRWAAATQRLGAQQDMLGGTTRLVDPRTGESFTVPNNSRFYYRSADPMRPGIAGSDLDRNPLPELDFRRLLQMGTDIPYR